MQVPHELESKFQSLTGLESQKPKTWHKMSETKNL